MFPSLYSSPAVSYTHLFGIKVVVITGWDNSDVPKQIRLCGQLFGQEEKAEELVAFYQKPVDYMKEQLKQVKEPKTVYWEYGGDYTTCIPVSYTHLIGAFAAVPPLY